MNKMMVLLAYLAIAACSPALHPITTAPAIADARSAERFCFDYMMRSVPAASLATAIATANVRQAVFDRCLAAHGWAE
jgi:hypothetical protein